MEQSPRFHCTVLWTSEEKKTKKYPTWSFLRDFFIIVNAALKASKDPPCVKVPCGLRSREVCWNPPSYRRPTPSVTAPDAANRKTDTCISHNTKPLLLKDYLFTKSGTRERLFHRSRLPLSSQVPIITPVLLYKPAVLRPYRPSLSRQKDPPAETNSVLYLIKKIDTIW